MGIFKKLIKIVGPKSDEDLADEYEKLRLQWLKDGDERKRDVMYAIDQKMVRRANKKYEKEHPDAEARHRPNGWYLFNDDDD